MRVLGERCHSGEMGHPAQRDVGAKAQKSEVGSIREWALI